MKAAEMLAEARALCAEGKTAKAKASLVVATCLFADEAPLLFELWRVCCATGDGKQAARVLSQACKTDALLAAFCSHLIAELRQPGDHGLGWLQGKPDHVERLVRLCLSELDLTSPQLSPAGTSITPSPSQCAADAAPACPAEGAWQVLLRLAHMTKDHPLVWWAAAEFAMSCDAHIGGGNFNKKESRLCTPWSHRLANMCLKHIVHAGAELSCDDVVKSKPLVERALIHHMASVRSSESEWPFSLFSFTDFRSTPHLQAMASRIEDLADAVN